MLKYNDLYELMIKKTLLILFICISQTFGTSKDVIKKSIDKILNQAPSSTKIAILIYNPLNEDTLYSSNHENSMIPASNTKLFTTATALSIMGGNFHLATKLLTDDSDLTDGIINGNLYIKGYGNSLFTEKDLLSFVDSLKRIGIREVTGHIIGDDTYFDERYTRDDWITDERANVHLPAVSALVLNRNRALAERTVRYRRHGRIRRRKIRYYKNISNPPVYIANILRNKLIVNGIKVKKSSIKGTAPAKVKEITESYILLKNLIKEINKHSDNYLAECLFKTIGAVATGKQGNSFYSTQTILRFIQDNGIYSKGTSVVDGSGISRFDQITVGAIVGLLQKMYFNLNLFEDFYNSLSIAGVDGTLEHRMRKTAAENNFHGKTGTLNGVSSLSGYVKTKSGDELIVSMLFEFNRHGANFYRELQDKIVELIAD